MAIASNLVDPHLIGSDLIDSPVIDSDPRDSDPRDSDPSDSVPSSSRSIRRRLLEDAASSWAFLRVQHHRLLGVSAGSALTVIVSSTVIEPSVETVSSTSIESGRQHRSSGDGSVTRTTRWLRIAAVSPCLLIVARHRRGSCEQDSTSHDHGESIPSRRTGL